MFPGPSQRPFLHGGICACLALGGDILVTVDDIPEIEQTALSLAWIRTMVNLLLAIGTVLSMDAIWFYALDRQTCQKIVAELEAREHNRALK